MDRARRLDATVVKKTPEEIAGALGARVPSAAKFPAMRGEPGSPWECGNLGRVEHDSLVLSFRCLLLHRVRAGAGQDGAEGANLEATLLETEVSDENPSSEPQGTATAANQRRGTRLRHAVDLTVAGTDALGKPFRETTKTTVVSCYGCAFHMKSYAPKSSQVTLEISQRPLTHAPRCVSARVIWVQRPQNLREQYQIAVALDEPGNVWRVENAPDDWFLHPADAARAAELARQRAETEREDEELREKGRVLIQEEIAWQEAKVRAEYAAFEEELSISMEGLDITGADLSAPPTEEETIYAKHKLQDRIEAAMRALVKKLVEEAAEEAVRELAKDTSERVQTMIEEMKLTSESLAEEINAKISRVFDQTMGKPWSEIEKPPKRRRGKNAKPRS